MSQWGHSWTKTDVALVCRIQVLAQLSLSLSFGHTIADYCNPEKSEFSLKLVLLEIVEKFYRARAGKQRFALTPRSGQTDSSLEHVNAPSSLPKDFLQTARTVASEHLHDEAGRQAPDFKVRGIGIGDGRTLNVELRPGLVVHPHVDRRVGRRAAPEQKPAAEVRTSPFCVGTTVRVLDLDQAEAPRLVGLLCLVADADA